MSAFCSGSADCRDKKFIFPIDFKNLCDQHEAMSVVEDLRQTLQDFVAPEMRAFNARLESLEERMNARFEVVNNRFDTTEERMNARFEAVNNRFDTLEEHVNARFESVNNRFDTMENRLTALGQKMETHHNEIIDKIEGLKNALEIDKRLERLERIEVQRSSDLQTQES